MGARYQDVTGRYIYKGIEAWMRETQTTLKSLAAQAGVAEVTMIDALKGRRKCSRYLTEQLLAVTGLTYGEAFRQDSDVEVPVYLALSHSQIATLKTALINAKTLADTQVTACTGSRLPGAAEAIDSYAKDAQDFESLLDFLVRAEKERYK